MQHSVSHGKTVKSAFLIIIMIIMTQVGYLDLINSPRTGNDSFDDDSFDDSFDDSLIYLLINNLLLIKLVFIKN